MAGPSPLPVGASPTRAAETHPEDHPQAPAHAPVPVSTPAVHGHDEHDSLEGAGHAAHQGSAAAHAVREGAHLAREGSHAAQYLGKAKAAAQALAEAANASKFMRGAKEASQVAMGLSKSLEAMGEHLDPAQRQAAKTAHAAVANYGQLATEAKHLAAAQSRAHKALNAALRNGAPAERLAQLTDTLKTATTRANAVFAKLHQATGPYRQAAKTARQLEKSLQESARAANVAQRAIHAIAETKTGKALAAVVESPLLQRGAKTIAVVANSRAVHVVATAAGGFAAVAEGVSAAQKGETVTGGVVRGVGQTAASGALYLHPALVGNPVVAGAVITEAIFMDKPHLTGPVRVTVQVAGAVADGIAGGAPALDRALSNIDRDAKAGEYGAVIKGANYFGQALADDGVGGVWKTTRDYWTSVSPRQVGRDIKDVWNWLTE